MPEFLKKLAQQLNKLWNQTTKEQKIKIGIIVSATLAGMILLIMFTTRTEYVPLYSNIPIEEAGVVVEKLEEMNIPYKITGQGKTIMVPSAEVYRTRMKLAKEGLPRGGTIGFSDVLERANLGTTDWERRVQYNQALQGELTRTIEGIAQVEKARVHIVIPRDTLFIELQQKPATAAVFLKLKPGYRLKPEQVKGIIHLVSHSVEGLKPENVTVIDVNGNILSRGILTGEKDLNINGMQDKLGLQMAFQERLEDSVQTLLEQVFGPGNVVVRVNAQLNFDQKTIEKNFFEPVTDEEGIIRSIQMLEESFQGSENPRAAGEPGVTSNIPTYEGITGENQNYEKTETIKNYEINEIREHLVVSPGSVKKLTVSVVINKELTEEERNIIADIVGSSIGYEPDRDTITVEGIAFDTSLQDRINAAMESESQRRDLILKGSAVAVVLLLGFIIFMAIRRNRTRRAKQVVKVDTAYTPEIKKDMIEELEGLTDEQSREYREVKRLAWNKPEDVAKLLRTWLNEE